MTIDPQKLQALFAQITTQPMERWEAMLDAETQGQSELRHRLEALLLAYSQPDSLLDRTSHFVTAQSLPLHLGTPPNPKSVGSSTTYALEDARPNVVIGGRYKLLEKIGEGGMGEVWMASQSEPVKRTVAIKLIKAGMDSKTVLARFEAERQALAIMDHPNIAKVLDGGLMPGGQPFFVMELVKGVPITEFCDRMKLSPQKRLELFIPVCQAIQHAHQKGIIHRDIKPSNVLVALFDDTAVPKVIDFGIAKATGGGLSEQTIHTVFGGVVGTPQYMSPEQAALNNLDIDTRSDVYSLGVLLYELLAGAPPFSRPELEQLGVLEILRVVREEEPPRPSVKLSSSQLLPSLSANRSSEPIRLAKLLRSELDWIVLKALEKERSKRYESAQSFATDIQRYLAGEQVLAHPPSFIYQLRKVARKNRGLLTAAALVLVAMVLGLASTSWQMLRANREAVRANQEATNASAAREEAEAALAIGLLRPIGYGETLSDAEQTAFQELAQLESDELKLQILKRALRSPETASRVPVRMDQLLNACVNVNLDSRQKVIDEAIASLEDVSGDPQARLNSLHVLVSLGAEYQVDLDSAIELMQMVPSNPPQVTWDLLMETELAKQRERCLKKLFDCVCFKHGKSLAELASVKLAAILTNDPAVARSVVQLLSDGSLQDAWIESEESVRATTSKSTGTETTQPKNPLVDLWISALLTGLPDDPNKQISMLLGFIEDVARIEATSELSSGAESLIVHINNQLFPILATCDDASFSRGLELLYATVESDKADIVSLLAGGQTGYKIAERMNEDQAEAWFKLLAQRLGTLYDTDAVIGVALGELGPKLSPEAAVAQYVLLEQRIAANPTVNVHSDAIQAIAGLCRSKDFAKAEEGVNLMLSIVDRVQLDYARNACWRAIGEVAQQLKPETRQRAVVASTPDIVAQLQGMGSWYNHNDPTVAFRTIVQLRDAGTEVDLESCVRPVLEIFASDRTKFTSTAPVIKAWLPYASEESRANVIGTLLQKLEKHGLDIASAEASDLLAGLICQSQLEDQVACVEILIADLGKTLDISEGFFIGNYTCQGPTIAKIVANWPEAELTNQIDGLMAILEAISKLGDKPTDQGLEKQADIHNCLLALSGKMSAEQKAKFLKATATFSHSSEEATAMVAEMSSDMLRDAWQAMLAKNETKPLIAIGAQRALKDPEQLAIDVLKLLTQASSSDEFFSRMEWVKQIDLTLSAEQYRSIEAFVNSLEQDTTDTFDTRLLEYTTDAQQLAGLLQHFNCAGSNRENILKRLEQLAYPEELQSRLMPDGRWKPSAHDQEWGTPRRHFKSLYDFVRWDQARPASARWLAN